MRIGVVSEQASPLAAPGGVDAGGRNAYVAGPGEELARRGNDATVCTRRDSTGLPGRAPLPGGTAGEHVRAGPPEAVPEDALFARLPAFGARPARARRQERPGAGHAHRRTSGTASPAGPRPHGVPVVRPFPALGTVERRHRHRHGTSPAESPGVERQPGRVPARVLATSLLVPVPAAGPHMGLIGLLRTACRTGDRPVGCTSADASVRHHGRAGRAPRALTAVGRYAGAEPVERVR